MKKKIFFTLSATIVSVHSVNAAKDILNIFGDLIQDFGIDFNEISESDAREIVKLVNEKCSKSLKSFKLERFKQSLIDEFKNAFEVINSLTYSSHITNEKVDPNVELSKYFPNVVQLQINDLKKNDWAILGRFQSLKSITLKVENQEKENWTDFLRKNVDVKTFELDAESLSEDQFLDISKILTSVETVKLVFKMETPNAENILHFIEIGQQLKSLEIEQYNGKLTENIDANTLEILSSNWNVEFSTSGLSITKR